MSSPSAAAVTDSEQLAGFQRENVAYGGDRELTGYFWNQSRIGSSWP
ncbi:hypothetical protein [Streptomyces ambofaciens]|nr:hypothetical protein [Streptomyces ambofaciens]